MRQIVDFYHRNFPWLELVFCVIITVAFIFYVEFSWGRSELIHFLNGTRLTAYGTLVSVGASMLGFVLTAVSIILIFGQSTRFDLLRQSDQYKAIFRIFFQAILWLALAALWGFVGLLADTDAAPLTFITHGMLLLALAAATRLARCVWILRETAHIAIMSPSLVP